MSVMTAMHQMHERTRQQKKIRNGERHMREVIDEQIDAGPGSDEDEESGEPDEVAGPSGEPDEPREGDDA
jgi:hypothetical protein